MTKWSLSQLFSVLHDDIEQRLGRIRKSFEHPSSKGDASENVWLELFQTYLPRRYRAEKAFVVDSKDEFSEQIDVVVFDRQYSPFIFHYERQIIIPAESVYAVFEAKQAINASEVAYAQKKVASVRKLYRTSLPIPHAGGEYPPKTLVPIYSGILTFESEWSPAMGESLLRALRKGNRDEHLEMGCVAVHGNFFWDKDADDYEIVTGGKAATSFLFRLISALQSSATVPMIDIHAYEKWIQ